MKANDRRIVKTKSILKNSLLELMNSKKFKNISVTELCDFACISKNTFYSHFESKFDLLSEIIDELFEPIVANLKENHSNILKTTKEDYQKDLLFIIEYVYEHYEMFHLLFSHDDDIYFTQRMVRMFEKHGSGWMEHISNKHNNFIEVDLILTYACVGQVAFLKRWVLNYHAVDKDYVKNIYYHTMINDVLLVSDLAIFPEKKVLSNGISMNI